MLVRAVAYFLPSSALLAVVPVIGRQRLGLSSGLFGLLYASQGAGAIVAALGLTRASKRVGVDGVLAGSSVVLAAAMLVGAAAVLSCSGWRCSSPGSPGLVASSTLMTTTQLALSQWVRGR